MIVLWLYTLLCHQLLTLVPHQINGHVVASGTTGSDRVVIVGAGIGGLAAAVDLAARGVAVTVVERAPDPGGRMRRVAVANTRIDAGPTVLTMRWVFDALFADAGTSVEDHLTLRPAGILARHAWSEDERLDLFASLEESVDAVAAFAGPDEARRFRAFCAEAQTIYKTLEGPFLKDSRPGPFDLARRIGFGRLGALWRIRPYETMWGALSGHFRDPRLRQLFGRYATYCGSSPWQAPATLMLVAHAEREGVWLVDGGMHRLAAAMASLAERLGATLRYGTGVSAIEVSGGRATGVTLEDGEVIAAHAVISNADVSALAAGLLGPAVSRGTPGTPRRHRSLSALTWSLVAPTSGFPLVRHSVFFSPDYRAEFDDLFKRDRLPADPTVYVCAQDRDDAGQRSGTGAERLLMIVNAPANGDLRTLDPDEVARCENATFERLRRCGLAVDLDPMACERTTPADFNRLFPGTGGAIYGRASHGWTASFARPGSRSRMPGLYLAGGSTHPGPGVPMAALSGRLAAASLLQDLASTRPSRRAAMSGGTSMH